MAIKEFKEILQKEAKRIDIKDRKIFERGRMPAFFGRGVTDTIEFILYDNGDNQLPQGETGKLVRYINISEIDNIRKYVMIARGAASNQSPEYFVDVEKLINEAGYKNGLFRTQITLLNKRVGSEHFQNKLWIHEISPSRTEIRVLPLKTEDKRLQRDLRDRYKILLQNGEFRDDVLNRLDGFIDSIDANDVIKKIRALYGQDWIDNLKKEFKISNFDGFINDVTVKAKQAIGYFISNRGYTFGKADYGKPLKDDLTSGPGDRKRRNRRGRRRKSNSQRLDVKTLQKKSMEIICDSIRFHLPKRNLQVQNTPTMTKLESRDRIDTILQTFGTSKKIDTKVTKVVKVVKPAQIVKATVTTSPKPIKITKPSKKYYFYDVYFRRRGFSRRKSAVVEYIDMSGDTNSFSMPSGKRVKICALEGSVKVKSGKGVRITKKELCVVDTPVPKFVRPKRPPKPKLTKEQKDAIKNFNLTDINDKIKFDLDSMQDEIRKNIKKSFEGLPKIKFNIKPFSPMFAGLGSLKPPKPPKKRRNSIFGGRKKRKGRVRTKRRKPSTRVSLIPKRSRRIRKNRSILRNISKPKGRTPFRRRRGGGGGFSPAQTDMGRPGGFGSGRVQNQFTPGNTFTGYSRGGY